MVKLTKELTDFERQYWEWKLEEKDDPNSVRIHGELYYIGDDDGGPFRGFGGSKFKIRFSNGKEIVTTNLWYNGKIPAMLRKILHDNAEFVFVS